MTTATHVLPIAVAIWAAISLCACSQAEQVSFKSGGMTHTFSAGKDATKNGFLLPIYPGAKPTGSVATSDAEELSSFLMLSSPDSVEKVGNFYKDEMQKGGWQVDQVQFHPNIVNLSAKKEALEASVLISGEADKTSITLTVGREPEGKPEMSSDTYIPDKLNPPTD